MKKVWSQVHVVAAFLFAICYFVLFGPQSNKPLVADNIVLTAAAFGVLGASPIIARAAARKIAQRLRDWNAFAVQCLTGFVVSGLAMFAGLALAIAPDWTGRLFAAILVGVAGAAIPVVLWLALGKQRSGDLDREPERSLFIENEETVHVVPHR